MFDPEHFRQHEGDDQLELFGKPKKLVWRFLPYLIVLFSIVVAFAANAQEIGTGLVCDTLSQVEESLANQGFGENVNQPKEAGKVDGCAVLPVKYFRYEDIKTVTDGRFYYIITHILVTGVFNGEMWKVVLPIEQYTLFKTKDIPA